MSVVALTSAHGAPGVTTIAFALASVWPEVRSGRRVLLVDADPAGSGLVSGPLRSGIPNAAGVSVLAAARLPLSVEQVIGCCVALDPGGARMVLPGVADPRQARPLGATWAALVDVARDLSAGGVDVVVDVGRLGHRWEPTAWLTGADLLAVVVRGDLASVLPAAAAVRALAPQRQGGSAPVGVVVDPGPYGGAEIASALGVGEVLTVVRDVRATRALMEGGSGGWIDRSALMRSARSVVRRVAELVPDVESVVAR
ncbi:hypothetical protein [Cellulomonas sp. SG140]|uniref:hypothetical protein n=1 Tax=Cellulomonas sp. SG140 TaxID=2976536 RepID=UPI0021E8EB7A|nr:hypothetical protein [Cellulomonas sp. SG140]